MKLYKANKRDIEIEEIEVLRVSNSSFSALSKYNGREERSALHTNYADYFKTYEEAKNFIISITGRKMRDSERQLEDAIKDYNEALKL